MRNYRSLIAFIIGLCYCYTLWSQSKVRAGTLQTQHPMEIAIFAGGCFWCTEAVFAELKGVVDVKPGYCGGQVAHPTYEAVCTGRTGHAEAIAITFDPKLIGFETLLEVFFATHDPTTLNRQGNDIGSQYRSAIFYQNESQKKAALAYIQQLTQHKTYANPIVTTLESATPFYEAEDYHQNYYRRNPNQSYCHYVITPKVNKVKKHFQKLLKQP